MRIIAGIKKGTKLREFSGDDIRPTTDRVKESLFNLIAPYVLGADVLDLFAGSGALCFEAISRGAASGVCTDMSKASVAVIEANRDKLGFTNVEIILTDALSYLSRTDRRFHLILMDPPYNKGLIEPCLSRIVERGILADDGVVVVESDSPDEVAVPFGLSVLKSRRYGRTNITVYTKETV